MALYESTAMAPSPPNPDAIFDALIQNRTDPAALRKRVETLEILLERSFVIPGINRLWFDPFILRYRDDPRFAAFCRKVGLPGTTDAKMMP